MKIGRPAARTFRDLIVWQKAHEFALATYAFTAAFPRTETTVYRAKCVEPQSQSLQILPKDFANAGGQIKHDS